MTIINNFIDIWQQFAEKHEGRLTFVKTSPALGGMGSCQKVMLTIPFLNREIVYTSSETSFLKIQFSFNRNIGHEFLIYQEDYLDRIGKLFGFGGVKSFNPAFDKTYFIKSDNEWFVRHVLDFPVTHYLLRRSKEVANFKLETRGTTYLELNAPFDETNMAEMEASLNIMQHTVTKIDGYIAAKQGKSDVV